MYIWMHQPYLGKVTAPYGQKWLAEGLVMTLPILLVSSEKRSGGSSQYDRHNMLARQLHPAKSQLSYFTSDTQISFASRNHQCKNDKIFFQWTLLHARGRQYAQIDWRCNEVTEFYSPISFLHIPYHVIQMGKVKMLWFNLKVH